MLRPETGARKKTDRPSESHHVVISPQPPTVIREGGGRMPSRSPPLSGGTTTTATGISPQAAKGKQVSPSSALRKSLSMSKLGSCIGLTRNSVSLVMMGPVEVRRKWRVAFIMVVAMMRMKERNKEKLTKKEKEDITAKYYSFSSNYGEITEFVSIRDLVFSCGQLLPETELLEMFPVVGYTEGALFSLCHFYSIMAMRKRKYVLAKECSDTEAAFAALRDPSEPDVSIPALLEVCQEYALSEDVGRLIEQADADESGRIDFDEFRDLLQSDEDDGDDDALLLLGGRPERTSHHHHQHASFKSTALAVPDPPERGDDVLGKSKSTVGSKSFMRLPQSINPAASGGPPDESIRSSDILPLSHSMSTSTQRYHHQQRGLLSPSESVNFGGRDFQSSQRRDGGVGDQEEEESYDECATTHNSLQPEGNQLQSPRVKLGHGCSQHLFGHKDSERTVTPKRPMSSSQGFGCSTERFSSLGKNLVPVQPPKGTARVRPLRPHRAEVPIPASARHSSAPLEADEFRPPSSVAPSLPGSSRPATAGTVMSGSSGKKGGPHPWTSRSPAPSRRPLGSAKSAMSRPDSAKSRVDSGTKKHSGGPNMEFGNASQFNPFLGVHARDAHDKTSMDACLAIAPHSLAEAASHHSVGNMYMRLICQRMIQEDTKKKKRKQARVSARATHTNSTEDGASTNAQVGQQDETVVAPKQIEARKPSSSSSRVLPPTPLPRSAGQQDHAEAQHSGENREDEKTQLGSQGGRDSTGSRRTPSSPSPGKQSSSGSGDPALEDSPQPVAAEERSMSSRSRSSLGSQASRRSSRRSHDTRSRSRSRSPSGARSSSSGRSRRSRNPSSSSSRKSSPEH